ncbi:HDOD domain-containing protein [Arsukibacterium indicum]|uniref:HDOD domain-containing protein n=1 Tax=Arsukibacterium indicum TaxID=2848612 RepID=A0ABS6MMD5_9GAMM|nr:HDOD domain-containing protein [Arsukibacterium indicum]MBV2129984.1 HDOD domain-containing protein [Arsukibacterium indicum]
MSAQRALLIILDEKIRSDRLVLPTLPDIALRVRERADDPQISLQQMADVISQDPALSARMIKVANSAFMGRSIQVNSLNQAVTRIGLSQIKNIAIAMAMEQLFVSQHKQVQQQLDRLWRDSVQTASVAVACLQFYKARHRNCKLSSDVMALAALVHNIGALPVLIEAERHPEVFGHPAFMQVLIDKIAATVGLKIIKSWGFGDEFLPVVQHWRTARSEPEPGYTDFVRLAAINRNYYLPELAQTLLAEYVSRELVPVPEFMQQREIADTYQDVRSLFN